MKQVFGSKISKTVIKFEFKNYLKKIFPCNKELQNAISAYEKLNKKYTDLVTALNTNKNVDSKSKAFMTAANALEKISRS